MQPETILRELSRLLLRSRIKVTQKNSPTKTVRFERRVERGRSNFKRGRHASQRTAEGGAEIRVGARASGWRAVGSLCGICE